MVKKLIPDQSVATIVIVHGAFEHGGRYDDLAKQFQKDGYTVIYGDLPGQGASKGTRGHINRFDEYIQTIGTWLKEVDDFKPVFLLGHSMGGLVVIRVMEELKPVVSGVILSSPATGILNGPGKPLKALSLVVNRLWPSLQVQAPLKPEMVTRNEAVIARDRKDQLILEKVSIRWYCEFLKATHEAFEHIEQFPDVPLLVMQAEKDLMVDIAKTKEWFNKVNSKEKIYKEWFDLYHELYNEPEWQEVYKYTMSFIHQQLISRI